MSKEKSSDLKKQRLKRGFQVVLRSKISFGNPAPDIYTARIPLSTASWINTKEGTVVIDMLLSNQNGRNLVKKIEESGGFVKYVVITHAHMDHWGGYKAIEKKYPEAKIILHKLGVERIEKYRILAEHRAYMAAVQFDIPENPRTKDYIDPTQTYDEFMKFKLGEYTFELYHDRAETDDVTWVWVPEIKTAFVGDLLLGFFPNIGNPFKPTRFALPWARTLEKIREKGPEMIISSSGVHPVYKKEEAKEVLDDTIEAIYSIHDQVVNLLNKKIPVNEMIHQVALPEHLKVKPHLRFLYSRPEFAVYNIYRWYHGYFDFNPAHLLPRPDHEINDEIFSLIGNKEKILERTKKLISEDKHQLALQVLDVLLQHDKENIESRELRIQILKKLQKEDYCLMSRNTWTYFINQDKKFIKKKEEKLR